MAVLACTLHLLYHVCISGFDYCAWCPPRYLFGFRLVFPFEYFHRLHHDSMIGPAIVYPQFPHGPWTYEPPRTKPYPEIYLLLRWFWSPICLYFRFCFLLLHLSCSRFCLHSGFAVFCIGLGIHFAFISSFPFFYIEIWPWYPFCLHFGFAPFICIDPGLSFDSISVPAFFFCLGLGPFPAVVSVNGPTRYV